MKTKILLLFLMIYVNTSFAQNYLYVNFEDSSVYNYHIEIDTINYPNNKWQIGIPSKPIFNSSFSSVKAIVTDTMNLLPASDTSVVILKVINPYMFPPPSFVVTTMEFYYKMNKDSSDIAMVEVAADTGMHWVDMLTEDTTYNIVWYGNKPNFSDTTTNWKYFRSNFSQWFSSPYSSGFYPYYADADTFLFRFTYISSSTSANKEGWMIDDMYFDFRQPENVLTFSANESSILFYPNPAKQTLHVNRLKNKSNEQEFISIYSMDGRCLLTKELENKSTMELNIAPGTYMLKYTSGQNSQIQKIVVE